MGEPWSHPRAEENCLTEPEGPWNTPSVSRSPGNLLEGRVFSGGDAVKTPARRRCLQRRSFNKPTGGYLEIPVHRGLAGWRQRVADVRNAASKTELPQNVLSSADFTRLRLMTCTCLSLAIPRRTAALCPVALFRKPMSTGNQLSAVVFLPSPSNPGTSFWKCPSTVWANDGFQAFAV